MPTPRKNLISLEETPYYHIFNSCVRDAYLCGENKLTGQNFEHRRQWLLDRVKFLSVSFTIDICAYAILSNHYHLVLKVNKAQTMLLSEEQVIQRWTDVYTSGNAMVERYQAGTATELEVDLAKQIIEVWRERLADISWFMRALNEFIARMANKEDGCKGHFWQSRFKSKALLDDMALLGCMVYVDLNPVRAGMAQDLNGSDFTSIQERIRIFSQAEKEDVSVGGYQPKSLLPFGGRNVENVIHYSLVDYFDLVDCTGRCIHPAKKGFIDKAIPKLIEQLDIQEDDWLDITQHFERIFASFVGSTSKLKAHAKTHGKRHYRGVG